MEQQHPAPCWKHPTHEELEAWVASPAYVAMAQAGANALEALRAYDTIFALRAEREEVQQVMDTYFEALGVLAEESQGRCRLYVQQAIAFLEGKKVPAYPLGLLSEAGYEEMEGFVGRIGLLKHGVRCGFVTKQWAGGPLSAPGRGWYYAL